MKKLMAMLALGILLLGCTSYNAPPATPPSNNTGPLPSGGSEEPVVHIKDFAFNPAEVIVRRGGIVTWVNDDSVPHLVKFPDFQSAALAPGDSFEHKFDAPGEFSYVCGIHPSMQGKVTVR